MTRRMLAAASLVLLTSACATGTDPTLEPPDGEREPQVTASVEVSDQTSDGTVVIVAGATIEGIDGFVVVHRHSGGPGDIVGYVAIPEGASTDVVVPIHEPTATGDYWAMIHIDTGQPGEFEFPEGGDVPVTGDDGMVMARFILTVERT